MGFFWTDLVVYISKIGEILKYDIWFRMGGKQKPEVLKKTVEKDERTGRKFYWRKKQKPLLHSGKA